MRVLPVVLGVLLAGCKDKEEGEPPVVLQWNQGENWYVAASYRVAEEKTPGAPVDLETDSARDFDGHWSEDIVWSYQVIEQGLEPAPDDELFQFAEMEDGSIAPLAVIRAYADASLNDDPAILEVDPVVYLVFREDRNRLAGVVSFLNLNGERVERAFSSKQLELSYSGLSAANLELAPTYLAPFGFTNATEERTTEVGSAVSTESNSDGTVDVFFEDDLGGGLVATTYRDGDPWPLVTVSDNLDARVLTDEEVSALRQNRPWLAEEPPEDYDYRAALAASVDIDAALTLDADTIDGGWEGGAPTGYEPWNGWWWPLRTAPMVFGHNGKNSYSHRIKTDIDPIKTKMDQISDSLDGMADGSEKDAKIAEYQAKQTELIEKLVAFYDDLQADLDGGQITLANGTMTHTVDGWSYKLDDLSPMDKFALQMYVANSLPGNNPFYLPASEILNSYNPAAADAGWWGHCNGWSGAAILNSEPTQSVTVTLGNTQMTYNTADLKALLSEAHYSTYSRFYGARYYKEGDDRADLSPAAFHKLVTFYHRDQQVPMVFDTDSGPAVWNFPSYYTTMVVEEKAGGTTSGKVNINTASASQLATVRGIGSTYASRIVAYRTTYGPFQKIEDVMRVSGIKSRTFNKIKAYITVSSDTRTFDVVASVKFATDGVDASHVDNGSPDASGFEETYSYTLVTDASGRVLSGTWDDVTKHPDFAWIPYQNPDWPSDGSGENGFMAYGVFKQIVTNLERQ